MCYQPMISLPTFPCQLRKFVNVHCAVLQQASNDGRLSGQIHRAFSNIQFLFGTHLCENVDGQRFQQAVFCQRICSLLDQGQTIFGKMISRPSEKSTNLRK